MCCYCHCQLFETSAFHSRIIILQGDNSFTVILSVSIMVVSISCWSIIFVFAFQGERKREREIEKEERHILLLFSRVREI